MESVVLQPTRLQEQPIQLIPPKLALAAYQSGWEEYGSRNVVAF
jgi:hypothetical protein